MENRIEQPNALERQNQALKIALAIIFACLLFGLALTVHVGRTTQIHTQKIISEITENRLKIAHQNLEIRANEAQILVGRLYGFLGLVLEHNTPSQTIRGHWSSITTNLYTLSTDVAALPVEPIKAGTRIIDSGASRIDAILSSASAIARTLQELIPVLLNALNEAKASLNDPDRKSILEPMLLGLDSLLGPLILHNTELQEQWSGLKADLALWIEDVARDMETFRKSFRGDALADEFLQRLWIEVF